MMIDRLIRPVTRQLGAALTFATAVLCIPTQGFAGPIGLSNMASVAVQDVRAVPDTDGLGAYVGAGYQGDLFAVLADDLRDSARAALASHGNWPAGERGHDWTHTQFEHPDDTGLSRGSNGRAATSAPTAVPEPNTLTLLGAGLVGTAMWMRRRSTLLRSF